VPIEPPTPALDAEAEALASGRAYVELDGWRVVEVRGADARTWLHDLVTADVRTLEPSTARRTLILTPTGRIRADLHLAATDDGFLLLQAPDQPDPVDRILAPYVLSSEVSLDDASERVAAFAVLGAGDLAGAEWWTPSVLGEGSGAVTPAGEPAERLRAALRTEDLVAASPEAVERWRIRRGVPRMGPDFGTDALPAEAGLESAIDFTKGCFLGQESVAKVRNLGHPPRAIVPVRSRAPLSVGMPVFAGGAEVGEVTSVAANGNVDAIARVRWAAAADRLSTEVGPLNLR
jgi:hypothetical protein